MGIESIVSRALFYLPVVALFVSACLAAYAIRSAASYVNTSLRLDPQRRISRSPVVDPIETPPEGESIPSTETTEYIEKLKEWIVRSKPDFIVGVHISGLMIAAKIADELGYPERKVAYYATTKSLADEPELHLFGNANGLSGRICVIDDVTRRGQTLEQVSKRIFSDYQRNENSVSDAEYAVMITARSPSKVEKGYFDPNFSVAETENQNVPLPWTNFMLSVRDDIDALKSGGKFEESRIQTYTAMKENLKFSLFCINWSLHDPATFYGSFERGELIIDFENHSRKW